MVLMPSLGQTLFMVIVTTIFSTIIGFLLGIILTLTKENGLKPNKIIYKLLDALINVIRSFPFIILIVAIIPVTRAIVGTSIGMKAAIVPLTVAMAPFLARLIETNLDEVNPSLVEAAQSFGASRTQIIFKVLIVEALPVIVSSLTLSIISVIGCTAMAGVVGAGGLGAVAITYGYQNFNDTIMYSTVIVLIIVVQLVQMFGTLSYKKLKK
ncbi:methionine ABC transporter permease [Desulfosporosinus sp. OT]|uniref:methionine ABC transporter permease n=1 Tax=Desulfosporosinus sp. OT TaxID=913865 RepID=UPI00058FC18C|nr:methionine ABC transporter permease [Desulfosporosinus sp. OT]